MKRMIAIGLFAVAGFIAAKNAAAQTPQQGHGARFPAVCQ